VTRSLARRRRGTAEAVAADEAFVTAEWVVGVGLLLVPVILVLGVVSGWASLRDAAAAAAREAARIAAEAPAGGTGPATAADERILAGRGVDWASATVVVDVPPGAPRQGQVTATVTVPGRPVAIPLIGPVSAPTATASHTRLLDAYRSRP
jgi:hypothetical protein